MRNVSFALAGLASLLAAAPSDTSAQQPSAAAQPDTCAPEGDVQFLCLDSPVEDLLAIPGTRWLVATAISGKGGVRFIDPIDRSVRTAYPAPAAREVLDRKSFPDCPGPAGASDKAAFFVHGLALGPARRGRLRLYAIHHGDRESIEVFDIDRNGGTPSLTWVGCVIAPEPGWYNSLVVQSDGGLVTTEFLAREPGREASFAKMTAGQINGALWRWRAGRGWSRLAGSEGSGLNGIEQSKDGKTLYVAGWGSRTFIRMPLADPAKRDTVSVGFRLDNVRWAPDGTLLGAGSVPKEEGAAGSKVVRIDPRTMAVTELFAREPTATFASAASALQVGRELWITAPRYTRIAIIPAPK